MRQCKWYINKIVIVGIFSQSSSEKRQFFKAERLFYKCFLCVGNFKIPKIRKTQSFRFFFNFGFLATVANFCSTGEVSFITGSTAAFWTVTLAGGIFSLFSLWAARFSCFFFDSLCMGGGWVGTLLVVTTHRDEHFCYNEKTYLSLL